MKTYQSKELMTEDSSFHIFSMTEGACEMPIHEHDFIEIVYVTDGEAAHTEKTPCARVFVSRIIDNLQKM